jgi:hypothetical protein
MARRTWLWILAIAVLIELWLIYNSQQYQNTATIYLLGTLAVIVIIANWEKIVGKK